MATDIDRRQFISALGGATVAWPLAARAQDPGRLRRIGVLMSNAADDPLGQAWTMAFTQGLQQLGWEVGRNMRIDYRWGAGDMERFRSYASELVASAPDVILANAGSIVAALQQASRTVPIVFVTTIDPVGSGLVASLARPGGNATGFTPFEFSLSAKLLELLKTIAPDVKRVAVVRDPTVPAGSGGFAAVQTVAPSLGVELTAIGVHNPDEIERGIAEFARGSNGGLVVVGPPSSMQWGTDLTVRLAAQYDLPAVYATLTFVTAGGLISYGADAPDEYRRAASYVDRVLKGEKPADLPVQAPTRYQLVVNLKTAKALNLNVPSTLLATADKVIE
jgi:putative tryptophan/tyrosine transport system substrate-binding protein